MLIKFFVIFLLICKISLSSEVALEQVVVLINGQHFQEAATMITAYLKDHPKEPQAWFIKALLFTSQQKFSEAEPVIRKAIKQDDKNPEYYRMQAKIFEELGLNVQAMTAWKNCLKYTQEGGGLAEEAHRHLEHIKAQ